MLLQFLLHEKGEMFVHINPEFIVAIEQVSLPGEAQAIDHIRIHTVQGDFDVADDATRVFMGVDEALKK